MTRHEELLELRKHPRHYLWNIPRKDWTADDLENLKNPEGMTKNPSKRNYMKRGSMAQEDQVFNPVRIKKQKKESRPHLRKVAVLKDGSEQQFDSIVEASNKLEIPLGRLYGFVNGYMTTKDGSVWRKLN